MKVSPVPSNECERVMALRELNILDTPSEKDFDDMSELPSLGVINPNFSFVIESLENAKDNEVKYASKATENIVY